MPRKQKLKPDDWLLVAVVGLTAIGAIILLVKSLVSGNVFSLSQRSSTLPGFAPDEAEDGRSPLCPFPADLEPASLRRPFDQTALLE